MGKTYGVPRSAKGETRILFIFSIKSLLMTIGGALIGLIFYFIFKTIGLDAIGIGIMIVLAVVGFAMATLTIPDSPLLGKLRKAGGENLGDIVFRTILFGRKKKLYLYREGGKKLWDQK